MNEQKKLGASLFTGDFREESQVSVKYSVVFFDCQIKMTVLIAGKRSGFSDTWISLSSFSIDQKKKKVPWHKLACFVCCDAIRPFRDVQSCLLFFSMITRTLRLRVIRHGCASAGQTSAIMWLTQIFCWLLIRFGVSSEWARERASK